MPRKSLLKFAVAFLTVSAFVSGFTATPLQANAAERGGKQEASAKQTTPSTKPKPKLDHSGRKRVGEASFYAKKFSGRKMASGKPMKPESNNAASKTLPLGTKAKVTNLETGQSSVVSIEDRGPYVKGRIVDLSPSTAKKIGIDKEEGVAKVEVAPITVPQPDGSIKAGAAAKEKSDAKP